MLLVLVVVVLCVVMVVCVVHDVWVVLKVCCVVGGVGGAVCAVFGVGSVYVMAWRVCYANVLCVFKSFV